MVTGAVLDAEAVAVFASILRHGVVTLSLGQLDSCTTASGAVSIGTPLPPLAVHLRKKRFHVSC